MDIQFNKILIDSLGKACNNLNNVIGYQLDINISNVIKAKTIIEELLNLAELANEENHSINPDKS